MIIVAIGALIQLSQTFLVEGTTDSYPFRDMGSLINVPGDGSAGTQNLQLHWNPNPSVYSQDRACHVMTLERRELAISCLAVRCLILLHH